ncbi:MAG: 1-deoxy-D-xylulose-5-phosphate reductoisomerase [Oscillospiraceae bacterium]|jgi:1-deoxy-D-xylulose-5-phosphate reductoisomerase|nr:1-deoxy-D-xylulose-5-phosphate reductoisomerase [Oscillospiraceae bacterium]
MNTPPHNAQRTIAVLGSTGSIGTQTLDVAERLGIRVAALTANRNTALLEAQTRRFRPALAAVAEEGAARDFKVRVADMDVRVVSGADGVLEAAAVPCGTVVNALVGRAGLAPTLRAVSLGRTLALANKESLVCAGERVMSLARETGARILPVDSEHSAIFQCLEGAAGNPVRRILLTASGGPFRGMSREQTRAVTPADALRHPNWSMGAKVTVDSATLMNKGLEYIEAMRLFDLAPEQIRVLVHPQSVVHSAVEFADGAVLAQLGSPDMRLPIQYALTYPARLECPAPRLDLAAIGALTFEEPDVRAFPCLALAMDAAARGDAVCAALCDANESAVARFLRGEIGFLEIYDAVYAAVSANLAKE